MPDLRSLVGRRRRSRLDLGSPSPAVLEPLERIGCQHVSAGAPVAGFTRGRIVAGPARDQAGIVGVDVVREQGVFIDLCAGCYSLTTTTAPRMPGERRGEERT